MFLGQVSSGGLEVHFTPLVEFQKHQSEAPPCLQLKFFTDFMDSKSIVLMAGEYNGKVSHDSMTDEHTHWSSTKLRSQVWLNTTNVDFGTSLPSQRVSIIDSSLHEMMTAWKVSRFPVQEPVLR